MRRIRMRILLVLMLCAGLTSVQAAKIHPKAGRTAASFLKIAPGARAASLGEAFHALSDDAYALWWNPAGLTQLKRPELTAMHDESFQSIRYNFVGYTHPLQNDWTIGGSLFGLTLREGLERRSGTNETLLGPGTLTQPEGKFTAYDVATSFSIARTWRDEFSAGGTLKIFQQVIDDERAFGQGIDFGVLYAPARLPFNLPELPLTFSAGVQNIGPSVTFIDEGFAMPLSGRLGAAWRPDAKKAFAFEIHQPNDNFMRFALGGEVKILKGFTLRFGYKYRLHGNELGGLSGLAGGGGFELGDYRLDYSFNPAGVLGNAQRFSLSIRFGQNRGEDDKPLVKKKPLPAPLSEPIQVAREQSRIEAETVDFRISLAALELIEGTTNYRVTAEANAPSDLYRLFFRATLDEVDDLKITQRSWDVASSTASVYREYAIVHNLPQGIRECGVAFDVSKAWLQAAGKTGKDINLIWMDGGGIWRAVKDLRINGENTERISFRAHIPWVQKVRIIVKQ